MAKFLKTLNELQGSERRLCSNCIRADTAQCNLMCYCMSWLGSAGTEWSPISAFRELRHQSPGTTETGQLSTLSVKCTLDLVVLTHT